MIDRRDQLAILECTRRPHITLLVHDNTLRPDEFMVSGLQNAGGIFAEFVSAYVENDRLTIVDRFGTDDP